MRARGINYDTRFLPGGTVFARARLRPVVGRARAAWGGQAQC
jgi:hypothetical protein